MVIGSVGISVPKPFGKTTSVENGREKSRKKNNVRMSTKDT